MRSFLTFLAAYTLSQFYRSFLAVIAPELARELALDPQALGNLQAFWIAGFVAMQVPVGTALDTLGPRRTVSSLMLAAVAGAILFARAQSAAGLDLAMMLIGVGCGSIYMGAIYVFGRVNRPEQFALLCSWLLGIGTAGNLIAASPLAYAAETIGWRGAMQAIAAATALSALSVFLLIRDPPRAVTAEPVGFLKGLGDILAIRDLWPLLPLTAVGYAAVLSERGLWAGPYFSDVHGLAPVARGNALLAMAAAMSAGAMIYGPLDRWLHTRKWIVAAGSAVTAAAFLALGSFDLSLVPAILAMATLGAFGMTYGVLMAHGRALFPDHLLGRGITLMNVLFLGGAGVLQPLSGALMKSLQAAPPAVAFGRLHTIFGVLLMAALAVYMFSRDQRPA
ncbi:MAG: MFS transporter [Rhizobiales bacterium]|nr:MFS transporter [Hyphomicrobiales bacterium]